MVKPITIPEQLLVVLIKVSLSFYLLWKFGLLIGIPLIIIVIVAYLQIIAKLFNFHALNGLDKVFITDVYRERYQVVTVMKFTNFDPDKIRSLIIEKNFKYIPKLRCKLTTKFLEYWWQETCIEEAAKRITIQPKLSSEDELNTYITNELNSQIDIFNEIPYQIKLVPYGEENMGIFLFKYDHLLSDALGFISSTCMTAGNYSEEMFPKIMQGVKPITWSEKLFIYLVTPFYFISHTLFFLTFRYNDTPFKMPESTGKSVIATSNSFDLKQFEKFRKENNVSFNDIMVTSISMAMKRVIDKDEKYKHKTHILLDIPVGRRPLPKTMSDIVLENGASGLLGYIPLANTINDVHQIKKSLRKYFDPKLQMSLVVGANICNTFFPNCLIKHCSQIFSEKFDLIFTNVPGPAIKLNYDGMICEETINYPAGGRGLPFLVLYSYNGKFKYAICVDETCKYSSKEFITYLEESMLQFINA